MTAFDKSDIRHQPAYTLAEAARYLKLPQATLRTWVLGRDYPVAAGQGRFKALIKPARGKPPTLSFYNLIEAHVLRALRTEHGVSLQDHPARVEWDQWKFPVRLYPFPTEALDGKRPIAIDANIAFGRPVLVRNSISTHAIAERLDAGESVADLAADYDLAPEDIEQAALYERAA
jgi:uncharacterized protein (DUF433 family)